MLLGSRSHVFSVASVREVGATENVTLETFPVHPTPCSPDSQRHLVVYRNALNDKNPELILKLFHASGEWAKGGYWKIANEDLAARPHSQSDTHECYTVLQGRGTYQLGKSPLDAEVDGDGKPLGVLFVAHAGGVFVFPSGVIHNVLKAEEATRLSDFTPYYLSCVKWGPILFYNENKLVEGPFDMQYALDSVEKTNVLCKRCDAFAVPENESVCGLGGPLWRL